MKVFRKLIPFFLLMLVSITPVFSASVSSGKSQVSQDEWVSSFVNLNNFTIKYSSNIYLGGNNIANLSGSAKVANNETLINTNLSISSAIDMLMQQFIGDTLSGEYNFYSKWDYTQKNGVEFKEIKYTDKNSKKYNDAYKNYVLNNIIDSLQSAIDSARENESVDASIFDLIDYKRYEYKSGKYTASFDIETDDDAFIKIDITFGFSNKKLSTIEFAIKDSNFDNPLQVDSKTELKIGIKSYIFDIDNTSVSI